MTSHEYLMTIPRVKKCLEGDDGLITLCRLYDFAVEQKEKHMQRRVEEIGQIEAEIEAITADWNSPNITSGILRNEIDSYVSMKQWKADPDKRFPWITYMEDYEEQKEG